MSHPLSPGRLAVVAFVVGTGLLIPFEHPATLSVGVLCLVAFVVLGVFAIATPAALRATADEPDVLDPADFRGTSTHGGSAGATDDPSPGR